MDKESSENDEVTDERSINNKENSSPDSSSAVNDIRIHEDKSGASISYISRKTIYLTEVAPSTSSIVSKDKEKSWKMPIGKFTALRHGKDDEDKNLPKTVRSFYREQDEIITMFEDTSLELTDDMLNSNANINLRKNATLLAKISFACNVLLMVSKAVAAGLSGSLAVISSLVDSVVDLVSGMLIWWSSRAVKKRDPYVYPSGRTRLEPVSIVILSVIMAVASVQLIIQSIEKIVALATDPDEKGPNMDIPSIVIISSTIVIKLVLFIACYRVPSPSVQVLAQDHRNDVMSNIVALVCGFVGSRWWPYADPMGAVLISLYIAFSWCNTGREQIKLLTGYTANPVFLQKITWICLNHSSKIEQIDTVRAFHFGNNFIVEVDIVLPEGMTLKEAHDIGEPLQQKLERLQEVERAFVHLDYEFTHDPQIEHKLV